MRNIYGNLIHNIGDKFIQEAVGEGGSVCDSDLGSEVAGPTVRGHEVTLLRYWPVCVSSSTGQ